MSELLEAPSVTEEVSVERDQQLTADTQHGSWGASVSLCPQVMFGLFSTFNTSSATAFNKK